MFNKKGNTLFIALLILAWAIMLFVANPTGNFPTNDDYMYSRSVSFLLQDHAYKITDTYSPVLIAQVFWGTLFCLPFGFSYLVLRISVTVLAIVCSIAFYFLINRISNNKTLAFFGSLLITCNPMFFCLSNSFMTDIPFLTFSLLSFVFFFKALESENRLMLFIAFIMATLATFTRQMGIIIPVAFAITAIIQPRQTAQKRFIYLLPAIVIACLLYYTLQVLTDKGYNPYNGERVTSFLTNNMLFDQIKGRCGLILIYSGFFLFPLLIFLKNPFKGIRTVYKIWIVFFILMFIPPILRVNELPSGNYINTGSLGPVTIKGGTGMLQTFPPLLLIILKCVAYAGAVLMLAHIGKVVGRIIRSITSADMNINLKRKLFVCICLVGYVILISLPDFFLDRYILYTLPLIVLLIIPESMNDAIITKPRAIVFGGLVTISLVLSAIGTHDYFEWQRVRWQADNYLTEELQLSPHKIDGGYEFNGLYLTTWSHPLKDGQSWWYVDDDEYIVAFDKEDGYNVIKEFPCKKYFPLMENVVYVLKRK